VPPVGRHRYLFKLDALDARLGDLAMPRKAGVDKAMQGRVLERARLVGTYQKTEERTLSSASSRGSAASTASSRAIDRMPWRPGLRFSSRELFLAWLIATVFSGVPSTVHELIAGTDPLEATRAAGAMLVATDSNAGPAHRRGSRRSSPCVVVLDPVFGATLPRSRVMWWAVAGSAAVALLDLRLVVPMLFPSVASLSFWPQFASGYLR
jgi:hypothetical protein